MCHGTMQYKYYVTLVLKLHNRQDNRAWQYLRIHSHNIFKYQLQKCSNYIPKFAKARPINKTIKDAKPEDYHPKDTDLSHANLMLYSTLSVLHFTKPFESLGWSHFSTQGQGLRYLQRQRVVLAYEQTKQKISVNGVAFKIECNDKTSKESNKDRTKDD